MREKPLQRVWQLVASIEPFIDSRTQEWRNGNPRVTLHAGQGTLDDAIMEGAHLVVALQPGEVSNPLLAVYNTPSFKEVDVVPFNGVGLLVGPHFIAEFSRDLERSCNVYTVRTVAGSPDSYSVEERGDLLARADKGVALDLLYPKEVIDPIGLTWKDGELFIRHEGALPPFFMFPDYFTGVLINDGIKMRIEQSALKGASFNTYIDIYISNKLRV